MTDQKMKAGGFKDLILLRAVKIVVFILLSQLSLFFFISPSFSEVPKTVAPDSGHKRHKGDALERLKDSTEKLIESVDRGESPSDHVFNVLNNIREVEDEDREIQRRFDEIGARVRHIGGKQTLLRHQNAVNAYKRKASELKKHAETVKASRTAKPEIHSRRVKELRDFIEKNKPKPEYDIKSSDRGLPWKVVQPGEVILLGDSSGMPLISAPVVSQGAPAADDLSETPDISISSPEIQELARSLDYHPLKIFRYVYNNYNYAHYHGSMKGSLDTYWEKEGNDYDLSSLLLALLRASNIPSRYVRAEIILPIDRIKGMTGIDDPMAALMYLSYSNVPVSYYKTSGQISHVVLDHVYVEANIPYSNYRGTGEDISGMAWVPMDPSFKGYAVTQEGTDIFAQMGLNWKAFADEYLGELRNMTPMEYY